MTQDSRTWQCPFCRHHAVVQDNVNLKEHTFTFNMDNKYGVQKVVSTIIVCPNENCREYAYFVDIIDLRRIPSVAGLGGLVPPDRLVPGDIRYQWQLLPESRTIIFPDYIPKGLLVDYREACLIRDKSPKASATLSRRCLQGMIHDFWGIKKSKLKDEIASLEEKVDSATWQAIDAVRKIGNIGAHMEKDIDIIVEVDPNEAELLINLIETLFKEWYMADHARKERMKRITELAEQKENDKKPTPEKSAG